jgi:hypothetical protein
MSAKRKRKDQQRWASAHPITAQAADRVEPQPISSSPPKPYAYGQLSITQVEMIDHMNAVLGTSYPMPKTWADARFLIDGMVDEERRRKRAAQAKP